jgi:hypothetical protein
LIAGLATAAEPSASRRNSTWFRSFFAISSMIPIVLDPNEIFRPPLAIVYGKATAGTSRGGFFPEGVNGTIGSV